MDDRTNDERPAPAPGTGADGSASEEVRVDGLAEGLPGLPADLLRGLVDEDGFHLPEKGLDIPWSEVTGIFSVGAGGRVSYRAEDGNRASTVVAGGDRERWAVVEAAWLEYVTRRIERDGVLRGGWVSGRGAFVYLTAPALLAAGGWLAWWGPAREAVPPAMLPVLFAAAGLLVLSGVAVSVSIVRDICPRRARERAWAKWELGREGLVHWPEECERRLSPSPGDVVTPRGAVLGGAPVRFMELTSPSTVAKLLLATGERSGAACRADSRGGCFGQIVMAADLMALAALIGILIFGLPPWNWGLIALETAILCVLLALISDVLQVQRDVRILLAEGRRMLERLGW